MAEFDVDMNKGLNVMYRWNLQLLTFKDDDYFDIGVVNTTTENLPSYFNDLRTPFAM